jgi:hypothetical protein
MIDKKPQDWSDWLVSSYGNPHSLNTGIEESIDSRASAVLQPDGTPFILQRRKPTIGFNLHEIKERNRGN